MKNDLISRQAALDAIDKNRDELLSSGMMGAEHILVHYGRRVIEELPTIEAVPVVRCKDCRLKEQEQPGMVYCPATVGGWVDEDWFCKDGETDA